MWCDDLYWLYWTSVVLRKNFSCQSSNFDFPQSCLRCFSIHSCHSLRKLIFENICGPLTHVHCVIVPTFGFWLFPKFVQSVMNFLSSPLGKTAILASFQKHWKTMLLHFLVTVSSFLLDKKNANSEIKIETR